MPLSNGEPSMQMSEQPFVVGAALVPGMPHLLAKQPATSWADLALAVRQVGDDFRAAGVDTVLTLSTQWFTVLGHQFQLDPNPRGRRVDENWYDYDYGQIDYNLRIDVDLTRRWVNAAATRGLQSRETHYEQFPIDTGTTTVASLIDPGRQFRFALVSCNLYAEVDSIATLAETGVVAAQSIGRRVGVLAISGLSAGLLQRWIEPGEDRIASSEQDRWNRRMLDLLVRGDVDEVLSIREQFARDAAADSQFRALAFLLGAGVLSTPAQLLAYGPIWGTGAAVLRWQIANGLSERTR
jgi:2-aminophenol/2-amino-5-chlorophenol 1,6-dioxygenase alpha subunit